MKRALYGLRQQWHARLKEEQELCSFQASEADPGLFVHHCKDGVVFLLVYVDDILIVSKVTGPRLPSGMVSHLPHHGEEDPSLCSLGVPGCMPRLSLAFRLIILRRGVGPPWNADPEPLKDPLLVPCPCLTPDHRRMQRSFIIILQSPGSEMRVAELVSVRWRDLGEARVLFGHDD